MHIFICSQSPLFRFVSIRWLLGIVRLLVRYYCTVGSRSTSISLHSHFIVFLNILLAESNTGCIFSGFEYHLVYSVSPVARCRHCHEYYKRAYLLVLSHAVLCIGSCQWHILFQWFFMNHLCRLIGYLYHTPPTLMSFAVSESWLRKATKNSEISIPKVQHFPSR